jgi:hypothetical protein
MRAATVPSVAATAVAQLPEGGAVVEVGVVVDVARAVEPVDEFEDAELVLNEALVALCVAAAEPQPTSATARHARRSRPRCRLLAAVPWAILRASFTPTG